MVRAALRVASGRADVLHVHLAHRGSVFRKSAPILAARLRGIPVVMHAHSYNFAAWYRATSPRVQSLTRHVLRADRWLVLGNDLADEYTEVLALDPDRVEVLHNPAPKPHVVTPDPEAPILGLALGRLGERKGTFDVIAAIRSLNPATRARLRVILAGDGEVDRARAQSADLDCVEIRDWVGPAERDDLLARATFFLLPSYDEGLPMALLEAMAAGLIPVVSPVGAIPDVVRNLENGILVSPGDIDATAKAIGMIVSDRAGAAMLSKAAVATAEQFGVEGWHDALLRVWTQVVEAREDGR